MKYYYEFSSCIGTILIVSDGTCLVELKINAKPEQNWIENEELEIFKKTKKWLDDYFKGKVPTIDLPLKLEGSIFQKEVWDILLKIPYGKVVTYGEIANQIAFKRNISKMSSQAVGNAVHQNPIPIIVPCHRVVGKNNNLVGYGLGMDLKIKLLKLEGVSLNRCYYYDGKLKRYVD